MQRKEQTGSKRKQQAEVKLKPCFISQASLRKHQGLYSLGNRGTRRQIALGSRRHPDLSADSIQASNQDNTCLLLPALTLRCQAFCLQTGHTVYALHPKEEPGRNLRSAVNHCLAASKNQKAPHHVFSTLPKKRAPAWF